MVKNKRRKKGKKETTSCQCAMSYHASEKWNLRTNSSSLGIVAIFITIITFLMTTLVRQVAILQGQTEQLRKDNETLAVENRILRQKITDVEQTMMRLEMQLENLHERPRLRKRSGLDVLQGERFNRVRYHSLLTPELEQNGFQYNDEGVSCWEWTQQKPP